MIAIIFFVLLFAGFMLYYLRFTLKYLAFKCDNSDPIKQTVTIVQSRVLPVNYEVSFALDERMIKHYADSQKISEDAVARNFAANKLADEMFKLVKEDENNQLFNLVRHNERYRFRNQFERELKYFTLHFSIVPEYDHSNKLPYGSKLI